ncbi:hypothetical protein B0H16DRAFT_1326939, partial [Mycena metata]
MSIAHVQKTIQDLRDRLAFHEREMASLTIQIAAHNTTLNLLQDPISQLPLEIATHIFSLCPSTFPSLVDPFSAPLLLTQVSNTWADITIATPSLW